MVTVLEKHKNMFGKDKLGKQQQQCLSLLLSILHGGAEKKHEQSSHTFHWVQVTNNILASCEETQILSFL